MTKLDLGKICPELAEIRRTKEEDLKEFPIHTWRNYQIDHESIDAISATMLKLAEENRELANNIQGCYNCGSQIHIGEKNVCEGCFEAARKGDPHDR